MKRADIETRITTVQRLFSETTNTTTLAILGKLLEKLVLMEADDDCRFDDTHCSQCGRSFGPGDHGFSACQEHQSDK